MILSSVPIGQGVDLTFDRGTFYTETKSKNVTTWTACQDDSGDDLWPQVGKFGYASEDRSSSVTIIDPGSNYGYLNEDQVRQATNCGYGIIAVDFLLNKGLTQEYIAQATNHLPFLPDFGTDTRREASV